MAGSGIVAQLVSRVSVEDNLVTEAGQRGVFLRSTLASEVRGNRVSAVGLESPGRYDAIELQASAHDNLVSENACRHRCLRAARPSASAPGACATACSAT